MDDRRRDGGTSSTLRIKEQGTHLTLHEHDDDDDENLLKTAYVTYNFKRRVVESVKRNLWQVFELRLAVFRKIKLTNRKLFVQLLPFLLCVPLTCTSGCSPSRKSAQQIAALVVSCPCESKSVMKVCSYQITVQSKMLCFSIEPRFTEITVLPGRINKRNIM